MKALRLLGVFLFMGIVAIAFGACGSDSDPEPVTVRPYVRLGQNTFELDAKAQTVSVTVETNMPEIVEIWIPNEYPWITLQDQRDADKSKTCVFKIEANTSSERRMGAVAFTATNEELVAMPATITFYQAAAEEP